MLGKHGRRVFALLTILSGALELGTPLTHALSLSADDVILRSHQARNPGDAAFSTYRVELSTKGGATVRRIVSAYRKICDGASKQLIVFRAPADIAGAAFLSWIHPNRAPDMWLYLPEIGRPRQVNPATRGETFLGSDFTYEDLGAPAGDARSHVIVGEPVLEGEPAYQIESRPHAPDHYGRIVTWVHQATFLPLRVEYFDARGGLLRVGRFGNVQLVKGIPTPFELEMANVRTGHRTDVTLLEADYGRAFDCGLFSARGLSRAIP